MNNIIGCYIIGRNLGVVTLSAGSPLTKLIALTSFLPELSLKLRPSRYPQTQGEVPVDLLASDPMRPTVPIIGDV